MNDFETVRRSLRRRASIGTLLTQRPVLWIIYAACLGVTVLELHVVPQLCRIHP